MKRIIFFLSVCMAGTLASAQTKVHLNLSSTISQEAAPIVLKLTPYGKISSAIVMLDGKEVPCQLDDLNKDGVMDELSFLADIQKGITSKATIRLDKSGAPKEYPQRTFAEIVLRNPKVTEKNKQDIYLSSITVDKKTTNPYNVLHHHGVAFENELIGMRIYMDHRQTIDLYGKFHQGLELESTQFYTSKEQKAQGYGDDVLWVGNSFGLGALRGWDGSKPTMLDNVAHRTHRIVAMGPVRTIVEVEDNGWTIASGQEPINMTLCYTLYAGHRDFDVDVKFNRNMTGNEFATGIINVKNSTEYSDHQGLRGCWGTDWPASDTLNWKRETVGLGIYVPTAYRVKEMPADKDNYTTVVKPIGNTIRYSLAYTSDNEDYGYHSADQWNSYLKEWKKRKENPVVIKKR
ncbi:MAG: DUF4861 domain-containing protein [Prevotella sp.]|nr:DUF4861 domain-containing protein [Prevotella sp.]